MNKFKFQPPKQHRRTLQAPKSEHVPLISVLQKCSQIVRDDRLWLHTQIKNNNSEILQIFKEFSKPAQLQQLQVKLRKYVQIAKNQFKAEQLSKFKESLRLNSVPSNLLMPQPKRSHQVRQDPSSKDANFKSNGSAILNHTSNLRNHKSQEHNNIFNPLQINARSHHFQNFNDQKYSTHVIDERDSENVTSARLNRLDSQRKINKPLQQQNFDPYANKFAEKRIQHSNPVFREMDQKFGFPDFFKMPPSLPSQKKNMPQPLKIAQPWQFQLKNKPVFLQQKHVENQFDQSATFKKQLSSKSKEQQESIFDQHFNEVSTQNINTQLIKEFNNQIYSPINQEITPVFITIETKYKEKQPIYQQNIRQNQQRHPEIQKSSRGQTIADKQFTEVKAFTKMDQTLFTPLDLLNQCRNFLRQRQSSVKKQSVGLQETKNKQIVQPKLVNPVQSYQQIPQCLFNVKNTKNQIIPKPTFEQINKVQPTFIIPQIKQVKQLNQDPKPKRQEVFSAKYFQTFNQDKNNNTRNQILPLNQANLKSINKTTKDVPPLNFKIEILLEQLMEITEMNPFISCQQLINYANSHQNSPFLKTAFSTYFNFSPKSEICITQIATILNNYINQTSKKNYPQNDKFINSVYNLLDISQKGYIDKQDIQEFLSQIKEAIEPDNYEQISQQLWKLFEGADFNNDEQLTYWHLFIIKNSDEFVRVSELLNQFEFQIDHS